MSVSAEIYHYDTGMFRACNVTERFTGKRNACAVDRRSGYARLNALNRRPAIAHPARTGTGPSL